MAHPKKPVPRPNSLAGLAGDPPYPQYGPPDRPPPPTPAEEAERARVHAQYERERGVVWTKGDRAKISRNGTAAWWLTDSDNEYGTELTRADLRRLRNALNRELRDSA